MAKEQPALSVPQWLASVPAERRAAIDAVRRAVNANLPPGYVETTDWGMLAWVVPLSTLPQTHNGRPLLLAALSAHNKFMTVYLMSVFEDPRLRSEFQAAYRKSGKRLHMGGCCIHFKALDDLPLDVVGDAVTKVTVEEYIAQYQERRPKAKGAKAAKASKAASKSTAQAASKPTAKASTAKASTAKKPASKGRSKAKSASKR